MDILFGTLRHVILAAADTRCHENPREGATAELTDRPPGKLDHLEVELCHHGTGRAELLSVEEALGRPGAAAEARERAGEHDARARLPLAGTGPRGPAAGVPLHEAASLGAALNRLEHPKGVYRLGSRATTARKLAGTQSEVGAYPHPGGRSSSTGAGNRPEMPPRRILRRRLPRGVPEHALGSNRSRRRRGRSMHGEETTMSLGLTALSRASRLESWR